MSFEKLQSYLDSLEKEFGVPACDCIIMHDHKTVFRHGAGFSDTARTKPVSPDDLYFIYSATKVITCTAVMQLIESGRIKLTDTLDTYLPEFAEMQVLTEMPKPPMFQIPENAKLGPAKNKITIHNLLTMSSGLSYNTRSKEITELAEKTNGGATTREMVSAIAKMPLVCEPGTHWVYSLSHDVLAAVVEVVSGMKFSQYLQTHIFAPLEITDMHFAPTEQQMARLSAQYTGSFTSKEIKPTESTNTYRLTSNYESGGAGIACTVDAYGTFVDAMCNNGVGKNGSRILTKESIDLMRQNHLTDEMLEDFKRGGKVGYGYGLGVRTMIDNANAKSPIGEFGWDGAAGAYALIDPDNKLGIFYAQHILMFIDVYVKIHPTIRDLTYEALGL